MVVYGPYSFGQSFQRQPTFITWMIPLMTSRLRRGFTPRRFFGIACSIASSCSSVIQNKLGIAALGTWELRIGADGVTSNGNWVRTLIRFTLAMTSGVASA